MIDPYKLEFWDSFNDSLYFDYLLTKEEMLNTYRVTYKTDAKNAFDLWKGLIIKIELCD